MPPVPEPATAHGPHPLASLLEEALDALLGFVGATAGWVGLTGPGGRLTFPCRRGDIPAPWMDLQQGPAAVWGFGVREGPTLLNAVAALPGLGEPALRNLLTCPLAEGGQLVLANKPLGFTSEDALVLQGVAHLLDHCRSVRGGASERRPAPLPGLARRALDRLPDGALVLDAEGTLVYANPAWCRLTGFETEELLNRVAPFPFWVGHRELLTAWGSGTLPAAHRLPFQRKDGRLFWCHVESAPEEIDGRACTVAFLREVVPEAESSPAAGPAEKRAAAQPWGLDLAADLPIGVALTDRRGRVLWANRVLEARLAPGGDLAGQLLRDRFEVLSAATLERLLRDPLVGQPGHWGRLMLQQSGGAAGGNMTVYWLAVPLAQGTGFFFSFSPDGDDLETPSEVTGPWHRTPLPPAADWLGLLLRPGGEVELWDERWEALTGLRPADLRGLSSEVVLDWLFPRQRDRDLVSDLLQQSARRGVQAVLEVARGAVSQPRLCTLLPVGSPTPERWLLLVGDAGLSPPGAAVVRRYLRQFTRGLSQLLNSYLTPPIGLAELALDRLVECADRPPAEVRELTEWFGQVLESCMRATHLVEALQDLSAESTGDTQVVPLAGLVREVVEEHTGGSSERPCELVVEVRDSGASVQVNRRMFAVVLRHLLRNAEQAVAHSPHKRIVVRVSRRDKEVCCEVEDSGEGLPTDDWTAVLAPFYSTKGPFARDPQHAAQCATGLGLTVSQHLLGLHGGRLELRSAPGAGTTAVVSLLCAEPAARQWAGAPREAVRLETPAEGPG